MRRRLPLVIACAFWLPAAHALASTRAEEARTAAFAAEAAQAAQAAAYGSHTTPVGVFLAAPGVVKIVALLLLAAIAVPPIKLLLGRGGQPGVLAKAAPWLAVFGCLVTLMGGSLIAVDTGALPEGGVLGGIVSEALLQLILGALAVLSAVTCRALAKPRVPV